MAFQRAVIAALAALATLVLVVAGCDEEAATTTLAAPTATVAPAEAGGAPTRLPTPTRGVALKPPSATVLASGSAWDGEPFELVAQGTEKGTCIIWMFPTERIPDGGGGCGDQIFPRFRGHIAAWGSSTSNHGIAVNGWVSKTVSRVEITFEHAGSTRSFAAVTEPIPPRVLRPSGADHPRGIFAAFLPDDIEPGEVVATAYDDQGAELGSALWFDP
jgi:hypothetical protein